MKKFKFIYVFALAGILFFCSDDDNNSTDTKKPTFVINEPTDGEVLYAGDEIHVDVDFSDNIELASYKIDIHFGGDGHSHERQMNEPVEWDYEVTGVLSGKNQNIHLYIDIPENAEEGEYHFGVFAVDKAGNQSVQWIELDIHND